MRHVLIGRRAKFVVGRAPTYLTVSRIAASLMEQVIEALDVAHIGNRTFRILSTLNNSFILAAMAFN